MSRICRVVTLAQQLSGHPGQRTPAELGAELDVIEATPAPYPTWVTPFLLGASCAAFCGVIGGSSWQMGAAFAGTFAGHSLRLLHLRWHSPMATVVVTCAFVSAFVAWATARGLGLTAQVLAIEHSASLIAPGKALLASVLYLIPGVPLVQSLIDVLHFDLTAGLARSAHATLVLVCIAVGVLAFLSLTGFALT